MRPEITRFDEIAPGTQGLDMQWAAIGLMSGFESFENRKTAWNQFTGRLDALGIPWKDDPTDGSQVWDFMMNGEVEQATDYYLEHYLTAPLAWNLDRHRKRHYQVFAPMYEDLRVAAALIEDAERFAKVREEVRAMLQRPEWNNP